MLTGLDAQNAYVYKKNVLSELAIRWHDAPAAITRPHYPSSSSQMETSLLDHRPVFSKIWIFFKR